MGQADRSDNDKSDRKHMGQNTEGLLHRSKEIKTNSALVDQQFSAPWECMVEQLVV